MNKFILLGAGAILCLALLVGKATADKIQEDKRHEVTAQAALHLEDYFLYKEKSEQARDSHYLMRKLIEDNCRLVGQEYDKCKYLPKDLRDKFYRFEELFRESQIVTNCGKVVKKGWTEESSYWIQRAYDISNCDKQFVYTLEAENGQWDHTRVGSTGDIGFCQIAPQWHPAIVKDPNFYNQEWQLAKCYELYKGGTTFYGKANIWKIKDNLIFS